MRGQGRQIVNGAFIFGGATALVDILMQWVEHKGKGIDFTLNNYNGMRTWQRTLVRAIEVIQKYK